MPCKQRLHYRGGMANTIHLEPWKQRSKMLGKTSFHFYMVFKTQNTEGLQTFTLLQPRQQSTTQLLSSERKPYYWLIPMTGMRYIGLDGPKLSILNFCDSYFWELMAFLYHLHLSILFIPRNRDLILGSLMLKLVFLVGKICRVWSSRIKKNGIEREEYRC